MPQILSDYQDRANGGNGWLRYYTFKPSTNTVQATTYSPTLNAFETDANSSFTFPFDLAATQPAPFTSLGTVAAAGGTATLNWNNLTHDRQYEWYAVANGGGAGDTSPVSDFTVAPSPVLLSDTSRGRSAMVGARPTAVRRGRLCRARPAIRSTVGWGASRCRAGRLA